MRILSESEMDEVFGGQAMSSVTPTLPTVTVTAPRMQDYGGGYWIGGSSGFSGMNENTGYEGGSWPTNPVYYPALTSPPTPEKLECVLDSVAVPGSDLRADFRFAVVNSYAFLAPNGSIYLSQTNSNPGPTLGYQSINGYTTPTNPGPYQPYYGTSVVYAAGMDGTTGNTSFNIVNDVGQVTNVSVGVLSPIEEAIMTAAHEARHQYTSWNPALLAGANAEDDARTFAYKALMKYRADGPPANCPAQ